MISIIPFLNNLLFNVFVIGYKNEGESIVFFLENDFGVTYSGVIDSYEKDNVNETINILNKNNIKELDLLCWTHPHIDHSYGMNKLIKEFTSYKTKIVFPEGLHTSGVVFNNKELDDPINTIKEIILSSKIKKPEILPVSNINLIDQKQIGNVKGNSYLLEIKSLTPVSNILEKRLLKDDWEKLNEYCVSLLISVGGINFLFGGDIQDSTINKIKSFGIPEKIDYIKIPHHASSGSLSIENWLKAESKTSISCSTEFAKSKLPDKNVLNSYKLYTNDIFITKKKSESEFKDNIDGTIHTVLNVLNSNFYTTTLGNAYLYYSDNDNDDDTNTNSL